MRTLNYLFILKLIFLFCIPSCIDRKINDVSNNGVTINIQLCDDKRSIGVTLKNYTDEKLFFPNLLGLDSGWKIYIFFEDADLRYGSPYCDISNSMIETNTQGYGNIYTKCFTRSIRKHVFDEGLVDSISKKLSMRYFTNFEVGYKYFWFYLGTSILLQPGEEYHGFFEIPYIYRNEQMYVYFIYPGHYRGTLSLIEPEKYIKHDSIIQLPRIINGYRYYDRVICSNILLLNFD